MKNVLPKRPYLRNTKSGVQLIVPSKHTPAKTLKKRMNEKEQVGSETKDERESREA